jgi:hypothetical protein
MNRRSNTRILHMKTGNLQLKWLLMHIRGQLEKFMDWRHCATVMQREAVTVMTSCSDGVNVVVA